MTFIWRIVYRVYRLFSWARYFTARRFTMAGIGVLTALVFTGLLGADVENNVSYQIFTVCVFLLFVAMICSWRFKAKFSATRTLPRFGTVGKPFSYRIAITNASNKLQGGLTLLENLADNRPKFHDWLAVQKADERAVRSLRLSRRRRTNPFKLAVVKEAALPAILPRQSAEAAVELTPLHRGMLRFDGVTIARPDPLGLFRAFSKVPAPQSVLILPRRYPVPAIAMPGVRQFQQGGVALASNIGQSDEFVSLRDYRRGDPLRHIHWRSWARTGRPIVKEFEDEFFVRHALVLDTFTDEPHSELFEEAVSVAASFACTLVTQESLLDLLFVGTEAFCFTAGRGIAHADQMLEILASVRTCADKPFSSLDHLVLNHAASVSGVICVLLAWDTARREFVNKLKAIGVPVMVLLIVAKGSGLSGTGGTLRDAPVELRVLEVGKIEEGLAQLK